MGALISPTGYSAQGLRDWLAQRVSALILAAYFIYLLCFFFNHQPLTYAAWTALFHPLPFKVFTILALLSLFVHAWIGIWTVLTDYVKITALRLICQVVVIVLLTFYLIWGALIVLPL